MFNFTPTFWVQIEWIVGHVGRTGIAVIPYLWLKMASLQFWYEQNGNQLYSDEFVECRTFILWMRECLQEETSKAHYAEVVLFLFSMSLYLPWLQLLDCLIQRRRRLQFRSNPDCSSLHRWTTFVDKCDHLDSWAWGLYTYSTTMLIWVTITHNIDHLE